LSYPHKLKRKELTTFTGRCKAIFQGRLPLKKKDPGSFDSIGKLSIKEARCSLGKDINLIPTWLIRKLERIQVQPSIITLTSVGGSSKNSDGQVNDVVVQEEKLSSNFVTSKIEKKIQWQQESQCSLRRTNIYSRSLKIEAGEDLLLYDKFMEFLPNKIKRKIDVFFLSYKSP
jgi:hypothetical protein